MGIIALLRAMKILCNNYHVAPFAMTVANSKVGGLHDNWV
jgi:hypothetical protein